MLKKVVATAAATGGLVLTGAGLAAAAGGAQGARWNSPGVVSGNVVQVPVSFRSTCGGNTGQRRRAAQPHARQRLRQQVTSPLTG
ncbi:hypothetical protein Ptr902_14220 [Pyrenophora tritici-repentis]|nr:hypothetical protein Ptr902_14220 [Pyrenophora tritici-repentis]